jgi:hypothetical protein
MSSTKQWVLLFILFIFHQKLLVAQLDQISDVTYTGENIYQSVKIIARSTNNFKLAFFAVNNSFYRFEIIISFNEIKNLSPYVKEKVYTVGHGQTMLLSLSIVDENMPIGYDYKYVTAISLSEEVIDESFQYLYPFGANKNINDFISSDFEQHGYYSFNMNKGDTVYSCRKGLVAVGPVKNDDQIRMFNPGSLEVLNEDGTILIYSNMEEEDVFVKAGETIFPGQPLGKIKTDNLNLRLMAIKPHRVIEFQKITFFNPCKKFSTSDVEKEHCLSVYPQELVLKEMTKREEKKYLKKN